MKKIVLVSIFTSLLFVGCSAKKINENVDSITSDIGKMIEGGNDKSSK